MTRKPPIDERRQRVSRRNLLRLLPTGAGVAATLGCERADMFDSEVTMDKTFLLETSYVESHYISSADDGDGGVLRLPNYMDLFRIRSDVRGFISPQPAGDEEFTNLVPPAFEDDGMAVAVVLRRDYWGLRDHWDLEIGLFHARLDAADLEAVREAVAKVNWRRLPIPKPGPMAAAFHHGPRYGLFVESGSLQIEHHYPSHADEFRKALAPLTNVVGKLERRTKLGPLATLKPILEVTADEGKPGSYKIRVGLRNTGSAPVVLTDPRVPIDPREDPSDKPPRLSVRINRKEAILPPLPENAPRSLLLAPRGRWEFEFPWIPPSADKYTVEMRWFDYDGPIDPVPGQIPFMPLPRKGPSLVGAGPYPIRGTCVSGRYIEVENP